MGAALSGAWAFATSKAGLALIGATAAVILLLGVFHKGEQAGKVEDLKATTITQERIDDADAHGPRTPDDVGKRLRDGSF